MSARGGIVDCGDGVVADVVGNDVGFGGGIFLVAAVGFTRHKAEGNRLFGECAAIIEE